MERPMLGGVLHDQERRPIVRDVVVAPVPGARADRNAIVQFWTEVERLIKTQEIAFAAQGDAKLLADGTAAAVASDNEPRADGEHAPASRAKGDVDAVGILLQRLERASVPDRDG